MMGKLRLHLIGRIIKYFVTVQVGQLCETFALGEENL